MTIVCTFIIPGSLWVEPVGDDDGILVSGLNSYIEWLGGSNKFKLIGFSHYFYSVRPDPRNNNIWLVSIEGKWHTYINGELSKIEDEEFQISLNATITEAYKVVNLGRGSYEIISKLDGKSYLFKERRSFFVCEIEGDLVFDLQKRNAFVKYDIASNELASFEYDDSEIPSGCIQIESYLFFSNFGARHDLKVVDLRTFKIQFQYEDIGSTTFSVYKVGDSYFIFSNGRILIWSHLSGAVECVELPGRISAHLMSDDCFYVGFESDPHLYLYDAKSLDLLNKKKVVKNGFYPLIIAESNDCLALQCNASTGNPLLKKAYFVPFTKASFLSGDDFEVEIEHPIYNEQERYPEGEQLFILSFSIDASHDYVTIIRQSLAILEDAITCHAVQYVAGKENQTYSENFGGQIEMIFENCDALDAEQKKALETSLHEVANDAKPVFYTHLSGSLIASSTSIQ
ncbi:hypothetical protein [uncultured Microbulbifer sp.]|uniref:hypothetical protein n=1 Tax=uncultured Microbulbifer sp. TaxID=348147 RepID=UPI0026222157|nr:hypothetical protein [uncultured Microbulbifer sp.]